MDAEDTRQPLVFDRDTETRTVECAHCHRQIRRVMRYITSERGGTFGVCFASLHETNGVKDGWLDVILGAFGDGSSPDHVTFGCHVTPSSGADLVVSAVDAASAFTYQPVMGERLTRDRALSHPRIADFWAVVDLMLLSDPEVHAHLYGEGKRSSFPM